MILHVIKILLLMPLLLIGYRLFYQFDKPLKDKPRVVKCLYGLVYFVVLAILLYVMVFIIVFGYNS